MRKQYRVYSFSPSSKWIDVGAYDQRETAEAIASLYKTTRVEEVMVPC